MIEAGCLRNKKVLSSNNKTVGVFQNIIFDGDTANPIAFILVFLPEKNWFKRYVSENWARIGLEALFKLLPNEAGAIAEDLKQKGKEETLKIWKAYLKDKSEKDQSSLKCYLFPSNLVEEPKEKPESIKLKVPDTDLDDYVSVGVPTFVHDSQTIFALYQSTIEKNQQCILPITLNKTPIHQKTVTDINHEKGLITDLQLDLSKGQVASFIVDVMGKNAGKRLVPLVDVDFDTQMMTEGRLLGACTLLNG